MSAPEKYSIRNLGEYQRSMEVFETSQDPLTLPDVRLILRGDAHRFGPTWSNEPDEEYPFGEKFTAALTETAKLLMACGLRTVFAFMHGDEISLLLDESESNNSRRKSRLVSLYASTASFGFLQAFGKPAVFHTRLAELPNSNRVLDYFFWQRKVAMRNFLSRNLGLLLSARGEGEADIAAKLRALDELGRKELLAELGRPLSSVPAYEQFGLALWWEADKSSAGGRHILRIDSQLIGSDETYLSLLSRRAFGAGYSCPESLEEVGIRETMLDAPALSGNRVHSKGAPAEGRSESPREKSQDAGSSEGAQNPPAPVSAGPKGNFRSTGAAKREPFRIASRGFRGSSS